MAVEVKDVRKVVVIGWDTEVVKGKTASIQADGNELRVVANDGESNLFYPLDWTGSTEVTVVGSKDGTDTGTIEVTGSESGGGDGPDAGGEPDAGNGNENGGEDVNDAEYVYYNDGTDEDVYALVTADNDDGTLNLFVIPASGEAKQVNGVPRREKDDYGPEGGGHTWHS